MNFLWLVISRFSLTSIVAWMLPEVHEHNGIHHQPKSILHIHRAAKHDINHHRALKQRQQRPLVVVVIHMPICPSTQEDAEQPHDFLEKRVLPHRARISNPVRIRPITHCETTQLRYRPGNDHGNCSGEYETRRASESTLRNGGESSGIVSGAGELQRLKGANVAGQEGEDSNANSTLPGDAQNGQLKQSRGDIFAILREEEVVVPGSG